MDPIRRVPYHHHRSFLMQGDARMKTIMKHYIDGESVES
jgi:hypothetical protein